MKWFHSLITLTVRIVYLVLTFFIKLIKIMQGKGFEPLDILSKIGNDSQKNMS